MGNAIHSLIVAFVGFSLQNITQAGQKIGLARFTEHRTQGVVIWALATIGTSVAFFVTLAAISIGSVSLVGAMAGTGLVSLAMFSHLVMKERFDARELVTLGMIVAGAVIVGAFAGAPAAGSPAAGSPAAGSPAAGPNGAEQGVVAVRISLLWGLLAGGSTIYAAGWVITRRKRFTGAIVGSFSGFLGAYSQLFQEYGTTTTSISSGIGPFFRSLITNPITLVWAGLSVISMVILQFAYRHGRAIEIIPSFMGTFIVVPVVGGVLIFAQTLVALQWVGVVLITVGSVVLGRGKAAATRLSVAEAGET